MINNNTKELKCGLIGKPLGHSYSPLIHSYLGDYSYTLTELEENEVGDFLRSGKYDAFNVTIPYKKTVMQFLDVISPEAERIGAVNTITHLPDGRIKGDNTDYYGFSYMLEKGGIDIEGKKVMIIGSGGASMTVRTVAADKKAREIVIITIDDNNEENLRKHADTDIIVNASPVGMYPNTNASPVSLDLFLALSGVVDVIYNPSKTSIILDAEERGIKCISGLYMLVAQAKAASEFFTGKTIDSAVIDKIVYKIESETKNIMLVGMPGVGKTTIGKRIAQKLNRDFIDIDEEIVKQSGVSIPEIFKERGEEHFRNLEHDVLGEFSKKSGLVISCGGGTVIRSDNRRLMKQNSRVVFLKRDLSLLPKDGRPVSQANDLGDLYKKRLPFYLDAADVVFEMGNDPDENADKIIGELGL